MLLLLELRASAVSGVRSTSSVRRKRKMAASAATMERFSDQSCWSIWLMPSADCDTRAKVVQEMTCLQQQADGASFLPHVTLVGGIVGTEQDVVETAKKLASSLEVLLGTEHRACALRFTGACLCSKCTD
jgi:hypothetical protein